MADSIKVSCDLHGEKILKPSGVHVTVRSPGKTTIEFFSPCCRRYQVKEIGNAVVAGLRQMGVIVQLLDVPPEFFEEHKGGPLQMADLNVCLAQLYGASELQVPVNKSLIRRR